MQKEELLRDCAEKKSKIDDLESKIKDQHLEGSALQLKVEQLTGRSTNLEHLKS